MKKSIIHFCSGLLLLCCLSACGKKQPQISTIVLESESVSIDSISPDSSLVIISDTTTTISIVPNENLPASNNKAKKGECPSVGKDCKNKDCEQCNNKSQQK